MCHSWLGQSKAMISYSHYPSPWSILLQNQCWWTPCPHVPPAPEIPPLVCKHLSSLCSRSLGADGNRRLTGGDTPVPSQDFQGLEIHFSAWGGEMHKATPVCTLGLLHLHMQSPSSLARQNSSRRGPFAAGEAWKHPEDETWLRTPLVFLAGDHPGPASEVLQAREEVDKMCIASPALPWGAPAMALVWPHL